MTSPDTSRRTLLAFAVTLAAILYLDRVCISQSQAAISAELGLSKTEMGFVMMVFGLAYAIFELPGGWLGDRFGARIVLTRIVAWWSAFTIATGWAWNLSSLAIIRFLFGAGEAGGFPTLTRAFTTWFTGAERVRAQSITWLAARWSGAFTPLLVILALDYMSWRTTFVVFGSVGFVWSVLFYRWYRDRPETRLHDAPAGPTGTYASTREAGNEQRLTPEAPAHVPWSVMLTNRSVWLLSIQYACLAYGFWFYLTWLPTYIVESFKLHHADRYLAGLLAALPLFLAGISSWLTGWISPKLVPVLGSVRRVRVTLGAAGHGIACVMLLVSLTPQDPILAMCAMGLSCFGNDMVMPGSWTACMDMGGRSAGTLSGLMNTLGSISGMLAPYTIAIILAGAGNNWHVPIVVIAAVYGVGALCWLGIDPVTPIGETPGAGLPDAPPAVDEQRAAGHVG